MIAEILAILITLQEIKKYNQNYQNYIYQESEKLLAIDKENAEIDNYIYIEPVKMRVTCYLPTGNHTASGCYPFIGSCAGRKEDIGKIAVLYNLDGTYVGMYEIRDCGGSYTLRNGLSIDVYQNTMSDAKAWIKEHGDYMLVSIIEAEG